MSSKTISRNMPAITSGGSLSSYLVQIKKFPMLSAEDEYMLAKSLGFVHPTTKKEIFFVARRPKDFDKLIKNLKKASI